MATLSNCWPPFFLALRPLNFSAYFFFSAIPPAIRIKCVFSGYPAALNDISDLSVFWLMDSRVSAGSSAVICLIAIGSSSTAKL